MLPSAGTLLGNAAMVAGDFVNRRMLAALGAVAYAACMFVFGLADSFAVLAAAAFLWGAASDAFVLVTHVALVDLARDDLESTLAVSNFFGALGAALAPIAVAAADASEVGWRPLLVGGGVLMLGYAVWLLSQRLPEPRNDDGSAPLRTWLDTIHDRAVLRLAVTDGLWDALGTGFLGFFALVLVSAHGMSRASAALVVAVALAGHLLAFAILAVRPMAAPPQAMLRVAAIIQLVATVGLAVIPWLPVVVVLAFAFGIGAALFWLGIQTSVVSIRPDRIGTVWAVLAIVSLPALAIPPLIGALADHLGLQAGMAAYTLVAVAVVMLAHARRGKSARRLPSRE